MNDLAKRLGLIALLGGSVALSSSCGYIRPDIREDETLEDAISPKGYTNPRLQKGSRVEVLETLGKERVNENRPIYTERNYLYIVGFSRAFKSEKQAVEDTKTDVRETINYLYDNYSKDKGKSKDRVRVFKVKTEVSKVRANGRKGYISEVLYSIPLSDLDANVRKNILRKYSKK